MTLDRFTPFRTTIGGQTYTFVTINKYSAIPSGQFNAYEFNNVVLYEGTPNTFTHAVVEPSSRTLYKIPALGVDLNTLQVSVQKSSSDTSTDVYHYADSVAVLTPLDRVFFVQEHYDGFYYIYFGDDVLGKKLDVGNIIKMTYLVTNGINANTGPFFNQTFNVEGQIAGYGQDNVIIETINSSGGGSSRQNTDDIRFLASKNYSAQGRTVTAEDFKTMITKEFPEVESLSVWGGESNVPPIYGKVFISAKPRNGFNLDSMTKQRISDYLDRHSIVSIKSEFVEPDYIFLTVDCEVKYSESKTLKDSKTIESEVETTIRTFFDQTLKQFDKSMYVSKMHSMIDATNGAILGNNIILGLQKRIEPIFGFSTTHDLYFNNKISPYSVISSEFNMYSSTGEVATVYIKDAPDDVVPNINGDGKLVAYERNGTLIANIGTVSYGTGQMTLRNLVIAGYPSLTLYDIRVNCKPQEQIDVIHNTIIGVVPSYASIPVPMRNQILMLDDSISNAQFKVKSGLSVTAIPL
jgi:hypothetical protein